jgi:hypothetical protein
MSHTYYNLPSRSNEMPPGLVDKVLPPSFLAAALYVVAGYLASLQGFPTAGTALKMTGIIPFYKAWEMRNYSSDVGKGV